MVKQYQIITCADLINVLVLFLNHPSIWHGGFFRLSKCRVWSYVLNALELQGTSLLAVELKWALVLLYIWLQRFITSNKKTMQHKQILFPFSAKA